MALGRAIDFLNAAIVSKELRDVCAQLPKEKVLNHYNFTEVEFEDAVNMELVKCQTYEQAQVFEQMKIWFLLL